MLLIEIVENPIMIALFIAFLTYMYLRWKKQKENEKNGVDNTDSVDEEINMLIPLASFLIAWFIAYAYFSCDGETKKEETVKLVGGGITVPNVNKLPDLFDLHLQTENILKE